MSNIQINAYTGPHSSYAEVGQTNPLRWTVLFKEEDGSFTPQTKKFKCKDFFNEMVAFKHGHDLGCYGFTAAPVKTNKDGVYNLMEHITRMDCFLYNIGSINRYAKSHDYPALTVEQVDDKKALLFIPEKYFQDTYAISLVSYLIRVANCEAKVDDWMKHPTRSIDSPFETHYEKALKGGFKKPVETDSYYYVGNSHDYSKKPPVMYVHNCGVRQWHDCAKGSMVLGY